MSSAHRLLTVALSTLVAAGYGCSSGPSGDSSKDRVAQAVARPAAAAPFVPPTDSIDADGAPAPIDLTDQGAVVWGETEVQIIDTTRHVNPPANPLIGPAHRTRELLPEHHLPSLIDEGAPNALPLGRSRLEPRTRPERLFAGIGPTGWVPPDCTLAVGPSHVISTVNMALAFYSKIGTQQYYNDLSSAGNPGFFEPVGAGGFTFDPKCFYDHFAQRFVVLAFEVYGSTEAWITFAVSDDDNPNGTWYKYRTNAVISIGSNTFWWDYPGFGYDEDGYYVTGNLFGLNNGGWGGVGFRVFNKAPLLTGQAATYATLRDGGAGSVQVAQHFGSNPAPYFVSLASGSALRIHAVRDPLTNPTLVSASVTVPAYSGPFDAPANNGNAVSLIDARIMNVHWRDGNLYAAHHVSEGDRNFARWYHLHTNDWPNSGGPTLVQSGNVDGGAGVHTWFPAIYSNQLNEVGMVVGSSAANQRIAVNTTGRKPGDPLGSMGALTTAKLATVDSGGRWGDFYDIAVDPVDDRTFWIIGEYPESWGWQTWITSFQVTSGFGPVAVNDELGDLFAGNQAVADVLANDYHTIGLAFDLDTFDAVSAHGGVVTLQVGGGPGGRDVLSYTAPSGYTGLDTFNYSLRDSQNQTATGVVSAQVYDSSSFRDPENPANSLAGIDAYYYALSSPTALPDFGALTPYLSDTTTHTVNYTPTYNSFATSGLSDNVGAVFDGYFRAPAAAIYTFYTNSDDGSRLLIGDTLVVDNDGTHGMQERSGTIALKAGKHALRVEFFEGGGSAGLIVSVSGGGLDKQVIPYNHWYHVVACPADLDSDGDVDLDDLSTLLTNFGHVGGASYDEGDLSGDTRVDLDDLSLMLIYFGTLCD